MIELFSKQGISIPITAMMVWEAYKQVKQGGEATGTDGMTWAHLHTHRSHLLYKLSVRLFSGSYFPHSIWSEIILKKNGSFRKLELLTLLDWLAQQVVRQQTEQVKELHFHQNSYGYRPGKNMH